MGPYIVEALLKAHFNLTVFTRANSKSTFPDGVNVCRTDYSPASLERDLKGQDAVISLLGNEAFQEQQKIAEAAIKAGVKRFIPSEFGINSADQRLLDIVPLLTVKKDLVKYLQSKEGEGMTWTGVVTGPTFDWVRLHHSLQLNLC